MPSSALFLGKSLANLVLLLAVELVGLPVFAIFYNARVTGNLPALIGVMALATWGLTVVGTMFSALTVNLRLRELMLPMLVYPLMIPCLMAAIQLTTVLLGDQPVGADQLVWLKFLVGFDIIYTALAIALVDSVLVG